MEGALELISVFDPYPLPFKYIRFQYPDEEDKPRSDYLVFYVNKVISHLILGIIKKSGVYFTKDAFNWNSTWGQQLDPPEYARCRPWQKVNHFAGAFLIGRKDELHKRMEELCFKHPQIENVYPRSFILPQDRLKLLPLWETKKLWISKPYASSKGEGIQLISSNDEIPTTPCIIQTYIERPLLINNKKFDVRLYVLVTSLSPLKIYLHEYGLVRFSTHDYPKDLSNTEIRSHLTNVSINKGDSGFKQSTGFQDEDESNSKWSIQQLKKYMEERGLDYSKVQEEFEKVAVTVVLSGTPAIRQYHQKLIPHRSSSYELFGLDVLIDEDLRCWALEINISPSMSGLDSALDKEIKGEIASEMFNIVSIVDCDPNDPTSGEPVTKYDSLWMECMKNRSLSKQQHIWQDPSFADMAIVRDLLNELSQTKKFRLIYPVKETMDYYAQIEGDLRYTDRSLHEFLHLSHEERLQALTRGTGAYKEGLDFIKT